MKKYFLAQLSQVSAWIGVVLIIGAFLVPRSWILILGVLLVLTDDEALKAWVATKAPWLKAFFDEAL